MSSAQSKALTPNPKDLLGSKKVSLSCVPPIAIAEEAFAMMDGAEKYGPYNWRDKAVLARIYVDAAKRHLDAWLEGEERASDSLAHHLGHARACCGILLDAQATGNLIDDRPGKGSDVYQKVLVDLSDRLAKRKAMKEQKYPMITVNRGPYCGWCGKTLADFRQELPAAIAYWCKSCAERLQLPLSCLTLMSPVGGTHKEELERIR